MNKKLITRRFGKAAAAYDAEATVQRQIAARMTSLLETLLPPGHCRKILEVGCGTGLFSRMLLDRLKPQEMTLNDLCPEMHERLKDILSARVVFEPGDAETYPFAGGYDLIASCSALQWFADTDAFFSRTARLLTEKGLLAFATFGTGNMTEIASLTGNALPYLPLRELTAMLSGTYTIIHASEEKIFKRFEHPGDVLYHLKRTGVTGLSQQRWTKTRLMRFCNDYRSLYGNTEGVTLTYHPLYVIAAKATNRQQNR